MNDSRLDALLAREEVRALIMRETTTFDGRDDAAHGACFGEDAEFVATAVGDGGAVVERARISGRDQVLATMYRHRDSLQIRSKHVLTSLEVEIDGDDGVCTSQLFRLDAAPDGPRVASFSQYRDEVHRGGDGVWRIRRRTLLAEATTPA